MSRRAKQVGAIPCLIAGVAITLSGCGEGGQRTTDRDSWSEISQRIRPGGEKHLAGAVAQIVPLGQIPYDNFSLPIVSSDGRYLATQTGAPPSWDMALARDGAEPPAATQIEIYEFIPGEVNPIFLRTIDEPALLGRSVDDSGFLIESIRDDGSRWIGHANWSTGNVQWLVKDEHVNAFASMGPNGRIAWCRRDAGEVHWRLVVRHGMETFEYGPEGESWLMPTWTGRGDSMFAMTLRDGVLDASYVVARSSAAIRQSRRRFRVASETSVYSAFQSLNGYVNQANAAPGRTDRLIYQHPALQRTAVWSPLELGASTAMHLNSGSMFAIPYLEDILLVATDEHLLLQKLDLSAPGNELIAGLLVPRATRNPDVPFVLLSPQAGYVALTGLQLLDRDQLANRGGNSAN